MFYKVIVSILRIFMYMVFNYEVIDQPEVEKDKRLIVCANHQSMLDILALACSYPGNLHFVAKQELGKNRVLNWLFTKLGVIFINRETGDLDAIRQILDILKSDRKIAIFPEGTRVEEINPKNMKEGVGLIALRGKSDVLCASIKADYRFRKPVQVIYRPLISYDAYKEKGMKQGRALLAKDIFNTIYQTDYRMEDF